MRKNKPISVTLVSVTLVSVTLVSVTLGDLQERVDARVQAGRYASASDVTRAALRARP
jgi:hypothetical protein